MRIKVKLLVIALWVLMVLVPKSAALFPAALPALDGNTRMGYLDEAGQTVLPFAYTSAGEFAACGLAAVENEAGQTALIDHEGNMVVPYTERPLEVAFSDDMAAFRYADHSVYYRVDGTLVGSYAGAQGFFEQGILLQKQADTSLYQYIGYDGLPVFEGTWKQAGEFSDGLALVQTEQGDYAVIDTTGAVQHVLNTSAAPVYLRVYGGDSIVLYDGVRYAQYSIAQGKPSTDFVYTAFSEFHEGAAMVRQVNLWGMMDTKGGWLTEPRYYYLTYLGQGLYAARGEDGAAVAVDAQGNVSYRTQNYVGGMDTLRYGISWHGTEAGDLIFFGKNGGYYASIKRAENPVILSEEVVQVRQDGVVKYINLATGLTLLEQPTSFALGGGLSVRTVDYERFLGYDTDGREYGWNITMPELTGLRDTALQDQINQTIRNFFLKGPSVSAEYHALEGSYGAKLEGAVLTVWANCISGRGEGASVWNDSIALDLRTGTTYQLGDLLQGNYADTVRALLPAETPFYLYSFPRVSLAGVTYFYNTYESTTSRANTQSYLLTYEQLGVCVNRESAYWQALHTAYSPSVAPASNAFSDVNEKHWAYPYIYRVAQSGLMQGANGRFRPNDTITIAEAAVVIARLKEIAPSDQIAAGIDSKKWYAKSLTAVGQAGLLDGLWPVAAPEAALTRAQTMQIFANLLVAQGATLPDVVRTDELLASFSDQGELPAQHRQAAALCVGHGLVEGSNALLSPNSTITRAQFAKLLTLVSR